MKSWIRHRRLAAVTFVLVLFALSSTAFAAVGRTVGKYAVSATGAATYTIPIWAPRGPNGLQPNISLVYNSQQGTGDVGVGWMLGGISSIYRCDLTYAQDGSPAPVALTTSDGLCLDGQRLRLTAGTLGEAGSSYQTEVANFENVTAYGSAGNGPAYFVVQAPNGTQYEYGNTSSSQVLANDTAFQWFLDKVTDTAGNTMTISYTDQEGSAVPSTISWTPSSHGATTYDYTMQFAYTTNADASSINGYVAGTNVEMTNLLQSITVEYEGAVVKTYALTYQQSPTTGADELTEIEECADAAHTNCLAPSTFTYQDPSAGTATTATTAVSSAQSQLNWNYDFSGDGFNDLAYCSSSQQVDVAFGSSSGYGTPINTGIACNGYVLYGDLLGNGKDGILADNGGTWYYYQWNGSSFVGQSTGLAYQAGVQYVLADVTGVGLPALVELQTSNTGASIYVRLNTSSGSTASLSSTNSEWWSTTFGGTATYYLVQLESTSDGQAGNVRHLHFTGDGREDLALQDQVELCYETNGPGGKPEKECSYSESADELISTGSGFNTTQIASLRGTTAAWPVIAFLNFNSDSCTDYIYNSVIYVSGCDGTPAATVTVPSSSIIGVMDWNGDGLDDVLINNSGTIGVYESTGTGLTSEISTAVPYSSSNQYFTFYPNGDGLGAIGAWEEFASPYAVTYYPHNGTGERPDLLSSATDGYGNFVKPTYVSQARAVNSTYFETNDADFPYVNYIGPLYIVNQTTFSDPSNPPNGTYQVNDYYSGAWMNLQGRGFAGFVNAQTYDGRNGIWDTIGYDRSFPFTGMLTGEVKTQNNSEQEMILDLSYSFTDTVLDSTEYEERYFPYVSSSTRKEYEVGGTENTELIRTTTGSYSYDDYGNLTSSSKTITDNDPGSPYNGDSWTTSITNTPDADASTWCLALLTESQVSYSASDDSTSVTRTRQYTPDTTNCRYTEITTEPSSSSYEVTEALGYDDFGNVDTDTITGVGMSARETSANWGTTGQFPMSITDATGATTQFNYDFSYGLVSSETDPNGLTTSWQFDGFGRPTQETRPDGTYTVWEYRSCAAVNGCLLGSNTLAISHFIYSSSGTMENDGTTTYDEVDRPYVSNNLLMGGTTFNRVDTRYDSLGRVTERSMPCLWSSMSDPCPYNTTYTYDILNRLTEVQRPINQNDSTLQTTGYAYAGDTTTITDPNGNARTLIKDVNGWLRQTKDAVGYAVTLGYDAAGSKTSVSDNQANGPTNPLWTGSYAYGIAPFLVGETDVDRGDWGYTVDALGERTAWTDAKGQKFSESYDALSRPLTRTEPDLFTQWTWGSSAASHNIGKLASVCSGAGSACSSSYYSESETYDSMGRPYQRAVAIPSMGTYTYTWQYSASTGLLNTLTYPVGASGQSLELQYGYQNDILQSITDVSDSPNVTIWQADAESPAGQITQETLGNGLVTNRAYDAVTQWLSSVQSGPGGGASIQDLSFLYDEVGNVTQRQDGIHDLSENFYYDNDYRLSYSTLNGTQNLSQTYDAMGNITSSTNVGNSDTWTYSPTHVHQVTEAGSAAYYYKYDANGNMTAWAQGPVTWTSYNYPSKITGTSSTFTFSYAPDRSVWLETETGGAGNTTYRLGSPLMSIVRGSSGSTDRNYIYAGSEPVAIDERTSSSNTFYYLLTDHQGSISGITNSSGQLVVGESFQPYGGRRNPTTWTAPASTSDLNTIQGITPRGYTFKEALQDMNFVDLGGRVEDDFTERFISADPNIPDPTNPQSYNRYSYTLNNPLTYIDPTGFLYETDDPTGGGDDLTINGGFGWDTVYQAPPSSSDNNYGVEDVYDDITLSGWQSADGNDSDEDDDSDSSGSLGIDSSPQGDPQQQSGGCAAVVCPVIQAPAPLPDSGQVQECTGCWLALAAGGLELTASDALAAATGRLIAGARGIGQILKKPFSSTTNSAGGTVWTSEGTIYQSDFSGIVNDSLYDGQDVNILSGVHGFPDGTTLPDPALYQEDLETFGDVPGVNVYNVPEMSPGEVNNVLNGPGTIIGGFCNSGVCLLGRF